MCENMFAPEEITEFHEKLQKVATSFIGIVSVCLRPWDGRKKDD
jgi:hypothetical protein